MVHKASKNKDGTKKSKRKKLGDTSGEVPIPTPSSFSWKPGMLGYPYPVPNLGLDEEEETEFE